MTMNYYFNPNTTYTSEVMINKGITFKQANSDYACPDGWKKYNNCVNDFCTKNYDADLNVWDSYIEKLIHTQQIKHKEYFGNSNMNNNLYN
jgi:hypothetical protein